MKRFMTVLLAAVFSLSTAGVVLADGETIQKSEWTKKSFKIKGVAELKNEDGTIHLILGDDFKTKNAPDLKFFLSPKPIADITGENILEGAVFIADLKKNKKAQSYTLPAGTDLSAFKSLVLHCEKYSKVWGGFDLE